MTAFSQGNAVTFSLSACGDANSWIYHFVKHAGGTDNFNIATGASGPAPIGILYDDPASGDVGLIIASGRVKVYADATAGAIAVGDWLTAGSNGQAVVAASNGFGQSLKAVSSGASVLIDMIWQPTTPIYTDNTP